MLFFRLFGFCSVGPHLGALFSNAGKRMESRNKIISVADKYYEGTETD